MANFSKLDKIMEIGVVNLGKYTFPKMLAFCTNTFDVFITQSEK